MLRIDGRVLAASVLGLFLTGAVLGFVAGGGLGQSGGPGDEAGGPTATPTVVETTVPSAVPTAAGTATGTATATPIGSPTPAATAAPTAVPTATPAVTHAPTATPARTPMLIRRFDTGEIERHLRRLLNDWREERGLRPFGNPDGRLVERLDEMATAHSVDMADLGETIHRIDNRSSAQRYRDASLFETCKFKKSGAQYVVTPTRNRLEVLGKTYAGRAYETANGTRYNGDERAVAAAVFESWVETGPYRDRLSYANATRIGIGIETTEDNEVYVTGDLCGVYGSS
ncbi:CAP domain-containing protein [Halosimplex aquaticum]|uniref:CAP domain-containing protein n=1 Tax=Halosimplex aquaticum TaxID=3026162 RepID=A0ABD5Y882_9EURY|nr:CAP domain-containing protein [Halosimplex aquaticum]